MPIFHPQLHGKCSTAPGSVASKNTAYNQFTHRKHLHARSCVFRFIGTHAVMIGNILLRTVLSRGRSSAEFYSCKQSRSKRHSVQFTTSGLLLKTIICFRLTSLLDFRLNFFLNASPRLWRQHFYRTSCFTTDTRRK
jgi:hypothetical protein